MNKHPHKSIRAFKILLIFETKLRFYSPPSLPNSERGRKGEHENWTRTRRRYLKMPSSPVPQPTTNPDRRLSRSLLPQYAHNTPPCPPERLASVDGCASPHGFIGWLRFAYEHVLLSSGVKPLSYFIHVCTGLCPSGTQSTHFANLNYLSTAKWG